VPRYSLWSRLATHLRIGAPARSMAQVTAEEARQRVATRDDAVVGEEAAKTSTLGLP
jgi:hypothetical protein